MVTVKNRRRLELADDQMCFGCGKQNARGLCLKFDLERAKKRIKTRWEPTKEFQGYANIVHGGIIALILDELMVNLLWTLDLPAVTAELTTRFHRPAGVGHAINCEARLVSKRGRLFRMEAEAKTLHGERIASASAKCVRIK